MQKVIQVKVYVLLLLVVLLFALSPFVMRWYLLSSYYKNLHWGSEVYSASLEAGLDYGNGIRRIYVLREVENRKYLGEKDGVFEIWAKPKLHFDSSRQWIADWLFDPEQEKWFIDKYNSRMRSRYMAENSSSE